MTERIVYFIHAPKADLIKIGVTTNLKRRLTAHDHLWARTPRSHAAKIESTNAAAASHDKK